MRNLEILPVTLTALAFIFFGKSKWMRMVGHVLLWPVVALDLMMWLN